MQTLFIKAGVALNSIILFFDAFLGNKSGKVISIAVIGIGLYIILSGFLLQVKSAGELPGEANAEKRAFIYKNAVESIAVPLGIMVGAIPTIIGLGLISKKTKENSDAVSENDEASTEIKYS